MSRITKEMGCWIQYQLKLEGLTHDMVAEKANRTNKLVSHFLNGRKGSIPVQKALCEVLGYKDFGSLIAAMPSSIQATQDRCTA